MPACTKRLSVPVANPSRHFALSPKPPLLPPARFHTAKCAPMARRAPSVSTNSSWTRPASVRFAASFPPASRAQTPRAAPRVSSVTTFKTRRALSGALSVRLRRPALSASRRLYVQCAVHRLCSPMGCVCRLRSPRPTPHSPSSPIQRAAHLSTARPWPYFLAPPRRAAVLQTRTAAVATCSCAVAATGRLRLSRFRFRAPRARAARPG